MNVSTKGRYAVSIMVDLAEHNNGEFQPLADIAKRLKKSEKYLEAIVSLLSKGGLVQSLRGKGGGYRLVREPEAYTVGEIIRQTEGEFHLVSYGAKEVQETPSYSKTIGVWSGLQKTVQDYFDGITIKDLVDTTPVVDNYVI